MIVALSLVMLASMVMVVNRGGTFHTLQEHSSRDEIVSRKLMAHYQTDVEQDPKVTFKLTARAE